MHQYLDKSYSHFGFKGHLFGLNRFKFSTLDIETLNFTDVICYNYTLPEDSNAVLRTVKPRVIELVRSDFDNFTKMVEDRRYIFAGLTIEKSTLVNSDVFAEFFNTTYKYKGFALRNNY